MDPSRLSKTRAEPSGVGALEAIAWLVQSPIIEQEENRRTAKVGKALKASTVSGLGTGPEPVGCGEQSPSRFARVWLRLTFDGVLVGDKASVVMGTIGGAGTLGGVFCTTLSGGVTRIGSGAAAMASRSISCETANGRVTKARAATATWRYIAAVGCFIRWADNRRYCVRATMCIYKRLERVVAAKIRRRT